MAELKDYAIGTLTLAILAMLGFSVISSDTYFCRERGISEHCLSLSSTGKTCYTEIGKQGRRICYGGWEKINVTISETKPQINDSVISTIEKSPTGIGKGYACDSTRCSFI